MSWFGRKDILSSFKASIEAVIVYGSSLLQMPPSNSLVDLILVVENTQKFHHVNMMQYGSHYNPLLRYLDMKSSRNGKLLGWINEKISASMYYNTFVHLHGMGPTKFKYGVISLESLYRDCVDWEYLYCSGRLHKPCIWIMNEKSKYTEMLESMSTANLKNAICTTLLLLPQRFSLTELYKTLVGISYTGDFRVGLAERPTKIQDLVHGSLELKTNRIANYYENAFNELNLPLEFIPGTCADNTWIIQPISSSYRTSLIHQLPDIIRLRLFSDHSPDNIRRVLGGIIAKSSLCQALKGILTVGPVSSFYYAIQKINKRFL